MKAFILECFDPILHFYKMRRTHEIVICTVIPLSVSILGFVIIYMLNVMEGFDHYEFSNDVINQFITMLTLFISFSLAYLSILVASDSQNITSLKETELDEYRLKNEKCSLYQVMANEITYTLIIEIFFLVYTVIQKFILPYISLTIMKFLLFTNVFLFVHISILMLVIVKNIYYAFWQSK